MIRSPAPCCHNEAHSNATEQETSARVSQSPGLKQRRVSVASGNCDVELRSKLIGVPLQRFAALTVQAAMAYLHLLRFAEPLG